jgi:hypothetical protein
MLKGILPYDKKIADSLKGIKWKELNEKIGDYNKVELIIKTKVARLKIKQNQIDDFIKKALEKIRELKLKKLE